MTAATPPTPSDPAGSPGPHPGVGTSAERTRLAWRRTALSATAVALLIVRLAVREGFTTPRVIAVIAAAAGWLPQLWITKRRIAVLARPGPTGAGRTLSVLVFIVTGYAVLGLTLVLTAG